MKKIIFSALLAFSMMSLTTGCSMHDMGGKCGGDSAKKCGANHDGKCGSK